MSKVLSFVLILIQISIFVMNQIFFHFVFFRNIFFVSEGIQLSLFKIASFSSKLVTFLFSFAPTHTLFVNCGHLSLHRNFWSRFPLKQSTCHNNQLPEYCSFVLLLSPCLVCSVVQFSEAKGRNLRSGQIHRWWPRTKCSRSRSLWLQYGSTQ